MAITVGLIALVVYYFMALPLGLAIMLGAALSPTDSRWPGRCRSNPWDQDRLRVSSHR